ncbi:MAG: site-specific integrase [Polyangia bacterium]
MARKRRRRGNGLGSIRKRGTQYQVIWRANGRRHFDHAPTLDDAKRMLAKRSSDLALGRVGVEPAKPDAPCLDKLAEDWLARRIKTHRSGSDDESRWRVHLAGRIGKLQPDEVTPGTIREIVEAKLAEGKASGTCQLLVRLLSTFYSDLCERGLAATNPAKGLPRATRRLIKPSHDPRTTPFVEKLADVERIYRSLPEPVNLAYSLGSFGGLRTGEILALQWSSVDLDRRRIVVKEQVQDGVVMRTKDLDSREVPILDSLLPVLRAAKLASGGAGQVVPPMRGGSRKRLDPGTLRKCLRAALTACGLPKLTWYQATRHSFASHWVKAGGSIEKLREVMGHSTVLVTERYAHLRGDLFTAADMGRMSVDLAGPVGKILPLTPAGAIGVTVTPESQTAQSGANG